MSQQTVENQIIQIPIDELGIDEFNVRKSPWNHDEDFIGNIKIRGIQYPLLVRPADSKTGVKYSIVHGSRRYNAAIDAGFKTVPCYIQEMTNLEAAVASFSENFNRDDPPNWQFALQLGVIANFLGGTQKEKNLMLKKYTGLSTATVEKYLAVSELPEEVIELIKKPSERTSEGSQLLKKYNVDESKILSLDKAAMIAKELESYPISKQMEVAAYAATQKHSKNFDEIIKSVKTYPKMSMEEIEEKVSKIPKGRNVNIFLSAQTLQALDEAAVKLNRDIKTLIVNFVEDGLSRKGFIR